MTQSHGRPPLALEFLAVVTLMGLHCFRRGRELLKQLLKERSKSFLNLS